MATRVMGACAEAMQLATAALTSKPRNCDGMTGKREVDRFVRSISTKKRACV